jgi:hypothetical protein
VRTPRLDGISVAPLSAWVLLVAVGSTARVSSAVLSPADALTADLISTCGTSQLGNSTSNDPAIRQALLGTSADAWRQILGQKVQVAVPADTDPNNPGAVKPVRLQRNSVNQLKEIIGRLDRGDAAPAIKLCQRLGILESDGQTITPAADLSSPPKAAKIRRFIAGR